MVELPGEFEAAKQRPLDNDLLAGFTESGMFRRMRSKPLLPLKFKQRVFYCYGHNGDRQAVCLAG